MQCIKCEKVFAHANKTTHISSIRWSVPYKCYNCMKIRICAGECQKEFLPIKSYHRLCKICHIKAIDRYQSRNNSTKSKNLDSSARYNQNQSNFNYYEYKVKDMSSQICYQYHKTLQNNMTALKINDIAAKTADISQKRSELTDFTPNHIEAMLFFRIIVDNKKPQWLNSTKNEVHMASSPR